MTRDEFDEAMAAMIAIVGREMPSAQVAAWRKLVESMDGDAFKRGVLTAMQSYRFAGFPPIGVILEHAGAAAATSDDAALVAWSKVLKAMHVHGAYYSVRWDDAAIAAAVESVAGGWTQLCEIESHELHNFVRQRFLAAYKSAAASGVSGETVSIGLIARDAGRLGGQVPEPLRIGEKPQSVVGFHGDEPEPKRIAGDVPAVAFKPLVLDEPKPVYEPLSPEEMELRRRRQMAVLSRMIQQTEGA